MVDIMDDKNKHWAHWQVQIIIIVSSNVVKENASKLGLLSIIKSPFSSFIHASLHFSSNEPVGSDIQVLLTRPG